MVDLRRPHQTALQLRHEGLFYLEADHALSTTEYLC